MPDTVLIGSFALLLCLSLVGIVAWLGFTRRSKPQTDMVLTERLEAALQENQVLRDANRELQQAAITDPLTGTLNRRFLTTHLRKEAARIARKQARPEETVRGLSLLMIDLDCFKRINDEHGHGFGDDILLRFAAWLKHELRETDYLVRWGGDEFVALAVDSMPEDNMIIADRIVTGARKLETHAPNGAILHCSCSIGVSHFPLFRDSINRLSWEHALQVADLCLQLAKRSGRNGWVSMHGKGSLKAGEYEKLADVIQRHSPELPTFDSIDLRSSFESLNRTGSADKPAARTRVKVDPA